MQSLPKVVDLLMISGFSTHLNLAPSYMPFLTNFQQWLINRNVEIYVVGGFIRDRYLDRDPKDLDLLVDGDVEHLGHDIARIFGGAFIKPWVRHSIVKVSFEKYGFCLDLTPLKTTLQENMMARDFTVDALALPIQHVTRSDWQDFVIDFTGGLEDLSRKLIRTTGASAIPTDPLRMLRAVRLAKELGFTLETTTESYIKKHSSCIDLVSAERIRDELLAILSVDGSKDSLSKLDDLGLLCRIIPELHFTKEVDQPKEHYWDVFNHTIESVGEVEFVIARHKTKESMCDVYWDDWIEKYFLHPLTLGYDRRTFVKLGALFHDIGKPHTRTNDEFGRPRFLGHGKKGAAVARKRMRLLRFSSKAIKFVELLVEHHLRPFQLTNNSNPPTKKAIYRLYRDLGGEGPGILLFGLADYRAARGPLLDIEDWRRKVDVVNHALVTYKEWNKKTEKPGLLTGHDLINIFGIEPGPQFGSLLGGVESAWLSGEIRTRTDAIELVRGMLNIK
jgi:poly(A) polymerase